MPTPTALQRLTILINAALVPLRLPLRLLSAGSSLADNPSTTDTARHHRWQRSYAHRPVIPAPPQTPSTPKSFRIPWPPPSTSIQTNVRTRFGPAHGIASSRCPTVRACITLRNQLENPCVKAICTRLIASTPPTSASGACALNMPAARSTPTIEVEHACTVENAGMPGASFASINGSRATLLQRRWRKPVFRN